MSPIYPFVIRLYHHHCLNFDLCDHLRTMIDERFQYSELTSKIIACAMAVHRALGNGFQEVIYQRGLAIEFSYAGIEFNREFEMPIHY